MVTQRDEEIENCQSTVKKLTSAVIDREEKIGVHRLELQYYMHVHTCIIYQCSWAKSISFFPLF